MRSSQQRTNIVSRWIIKRLRPRWPSCRRTTWSSSPSFLILFNKLFSIIYILSDNIRFLTLSHCWWPTSITRQRHNSIALFTFDKIGCFQTFFIYNIMMMMHYMVMVSRYDFGCNRRLDQSFFIQHHCIVAFSVYHGQDRASL